MSSEEEYLNSLLNTVSSPKADENMEIFGEKPEELNMDSLEMPEALEEEMIPDVEMPDLDIQDLDLSDLELSNIVMPENGFGMTGTKAAGELSSGALPTVEEGIEDATFEDNDSFFDNLLTMDDTPEEGSTEQLPEIEDLSGDLLSGEIPEIEELPGDSLSEEIPEVEELPADLLSEEPPEIEELPGDLLSEETPEIEELSGDLLSEETPVIEELPAETSEVEELPGELLLEETPIVEGLSEDLEPEALETANLDIIDHAVNDVEMSDIEMSDTELSDITIPDIQTAKTDTPVLLNMPDTGEQLSLEDIEMPGSEDDFKLEDLGMSADMPFQENELNIDGLDQAIQAETELQMAGELKLDELGLDNIGSDDSESPIDMDDSLEDVLNMLDDDTELAEINDMLKKSDNNEPIQDDMMDLLHQMADDEAASVNAGISHADDDDGVPLPELSRTAAETSDDEEGAKKKDKKDKKEKKAAKKKKNEKAEAEEETGSTKEPGKLGKFFNMLTEDIVPEPTEEELAAEKEAKEAKKQENKTKKEEEKLAKAEEKKAKAEEKAAADRVKQEAAAQKKKEKQAKKAAAKAAKAAAEVKKKRIPPKKIAVAVVFGASLGGAIVLATNILSTEGFLQTARNAYYDGDYQSVYEATYGMELDDSQNDGLIKAKSEVLFKIQRRYDSYQINLKMGREVEALDALLQGITVYDNINADAEKYGVMAEVDAIRETILNTLESEYGLDETQARALIGNQDALSYTIALNEVIAGKGGNT